MSGTEKFPKWNRTTDFSRFQSLVNTNLGSNKVKDIKASHFEYFKSARDYDAIVLTKTTSTTL